MPRAYGYCRLSVDPGETPISIDAQRDAIGAFVGYRLTPLGIAHDPADIHCDVGVSGGVPLMDRPAGQSLLAAAKADDHIVVAKLDRAFRNVVDGAAMIEECQRRGVALHFLDLGIDMSTPIGRVVAHVMLAFAELERARIGERIAAAVAARRKRGLPYSAKPPLGWRIVGPAKHRQYRRDESERRVCRRIRGLKRRGKTYGQIVEILRRDREPSRREKNWSRSGVRRRCRAAEEKFPLVSEESRRWGGASERPRHRGKKRGAKKRAGPGLQPDPTLAQHSGEP